MKKNIAVVGCGHWGKNLVRNYAELGSLHTICDPDNDIAKKFADKYKVNNLSFAEVVNHQEIEGIVIAAPASMHASMAIQAMNAGKHVYVEKPLAMNQAEAEHMIDSASQNKVQLMVGHLLQYHPVFVEVRRLVNDGVLGCLQYIYSNRLSFGKVRSEEDVIWSFAPHDISMILSLTGLEPTSVRSESACILQPDIADTATIHMDFISDIKAHISVSWIHPLKEQKLVVIGQTGMLVFDDTKPWKEKLTLYPHTIDTLEELPRIKKYEAEYLNVPESEPLKNECLHFIDVVNDGVLPITDGIEGQSVLRVLTAASISK